MNKLSKIALIFLVALSASCAQNKFDGGESYTTGWTLRGKDAGFMNPSVLNTEVHPVGMVYIQGGTFNIGGVGEFVTAPRDNMKRQVTVGNFYMDKYEISNFAWREYEHWMRTVFGMVAPNLIKQVLPDTTVWREDLAYNEPYVHNYYRHPALSHYPVVGISWEQAMAYSRWRTDRVNELALIRRGIIAAPNFGELLPTSDVAVKDAWENANAPYVMNEIASSDSTVYYHPSYEYVRDQFVFNTEKYLKSDYTPKPGKHNPQSYKVNRGHGIFIYDYRLPTEAEWEFAAYAPVVDSTGNGIIPEGKIYPWSGYQPRNLTREQRGMMQANFVRGRGDMMGVSGALNDGSIITAPINAFLPNDFGLYNMAGNVNEWVMDVYRETSAQEVAEADPFRGNIYTHTVEPLAFDSVGGVLMTYAAKDDKRNIGDGDFPSLIETVYALPQDTAIYIANDPEYAKKMKKDPTDILAPRINDNSRVYKGGSWKDRIYWLNPSTRRYLEQTKSSSTIGFRCAMTSLKSNAPQTVK